MILSGPPQKATGRARLHNAIMSSLVSVFLIYTCWFPTKDLQLAGASSNPPTSPPPPFACKLSSPSPALPVTPIQHSINAISSLPYHCTTAQNPPVSFAFYEVSVGSIPTFSNAQPKILEYHAFLFSSTVVTIISPGQSTSLDGVLLGL